jgi:hypothetical protein
MNDPQRGIGENKSWEDRGAEVQRLEGIDKGIFAQRV